MKTLSDLIPFPRFYWLPINIFSVYFFVNYFKPIFIFACPFTSSLEWIVLRFHSFLPYLINTKLSLTFGIMVLSSNDISCGHQAALHRYYLVLFINLLRRLHLYPFLRSHVVRYSLKSYFFAVITVYLFLIFKYFFCFSISTSTN